jgi:glycosyltransferase involved in cell wall biosynthesis
MTFGINKLKILFLHPNFPGQFRRLAGAFARQGDASVSIFGLGDKSWMQGNEALTGIHTIAYEPPDTSPSNIHPWAANFEAAVRRGQKVLETLVQYKQNGLEPDIIITHPGWGDAFFVRDLFPGVKVIGFFEYYYRPRGADVGFDPEFPSGVNDIFRLHTNNATQLLALESCDVGICPTIWQKSLFPQAYSNQLNVVHEGIDTELVCPNPNAHFTLPNGITLRQGDEVLTFVSRSLEPYRGFHTFIRALPRILQERSQCQIIVVGEESVSYGPQPSGNFSSWKEQYLSEIKDNWSLSDIARVHFIGKVPYSDYLRVLQISRLHVYLTYPFILSWSMLEAMSCACIVLASDTAPVQEVVEDEWNGYLFPFHSPEILSSIAIDILSNPEIHRSVAERARQTLIERFDFASVSFPAYQSLINNQ